MSRSKTLCKTVAMVSTNLSYNFKCACQELAGKELTAVWGFSSVWSLLLAPSTQLCSLPSCSLIWICCPSIHTSLSWTRSCPFMSLFGFHLNKPVTQSGSEVQSKRNITSSFVDMESGRVEPGVGGPENSLQRNPQNKGKYLTLISS